MKTECSATRGAADPVAIGAVGGSGTRMIAKFMSHVGHYMGGDLNAAYDNLWFTLLFKRRDILTTPRCSFEHLADIYYRRMTGTLVPDEQTTSLVMEIASRPHPQHPGEWLKKRAETLLHMTAAEPPSRSWGWKEPNTHLVVERLLELDQGLRYIHVVRHGLDMALSRNRNQVHLWGPLLLGRDVEATPRDSLAYWCAVHRRMGAIANRFLDRVMILDFDRFCFDPKRVCQEVLCFVGGDAPENLIEEFATSVVMPSSVGRFRCGPTDDLDPKDVAYVAECGYAVA